MLKRFWKKKKNYKMKLGVLYCHLLCKEDKIVHLNLEVETTHLIGTTANKNKSLSIRTYQRKTKIQL